MLLSFRSTAFLAAASAMTVGATAQNVFVDFESGVSTGQITYFTSDGSGFSQGSANLDDQGILPSVSGFGGSGGDGVGDFTAEIGLSPGEGVGGTQGANLTTTNNGSAGFTFAGIQTEIGILEDQTAGAVNDFNAFIDVLAPAGVALQLRLESPFTDTNNGFTFDFTGSGEFQTIGGNIGSDFTQIGNFDNTAGLQLAIANPIGVNSAAGAVPIIIDNVSFAPVPEPASAALIGVGGLLLAGRRRKMN